VLGYGDYNQSFGDLVVIRVLELPRRKTTDGKILVLLCGAVICRFVAGWESPYGMGSNSEHIGCRAEENVGVPTPPDLYGLKTARGVPWLRI
jgi:hypothetical protein